MSTAEPMDLSTPHTAWFHQMVRSRRGDQIDSADVVYPPDVTLGVTMRSATRRYTDSEAGIGLGGILYAFGPSNEDGEPTYLVVEIKANFLTPGARVEWHRLDAAEILWEEYSGLIVKKVLIDLRRDMIKHYRQHPKDDRYLTVLQVIAGCLS